MAMSTAQLFDVCAARAAEILRERFGMNPEALLRVNHHRFTIEGLVRAGQGTGPEWYSFTARAEQLDWSGPDVVAAAFVRDYLSLRDGVSAPG
jgi:hypothetical protein